MRSQSVGSTRAIRPRRVPQAEQISDQALMTRMPHAGAASDASLVHMKKLGSFLQPTSTHRHRPYHPPSISFRPDLAAIGSPLAMAPVRNTSKTERTRRYLKGGGVVRDDSDDELGYDDLPWEWIYDDDQTPDAIKTSNSRKRKINADDADPNIVGARMGSFRCYIGDTVLLKADSNEAWVGLICGFFADDEFGEEKMAKFMWFSTPSEIRNKAKKRTDFLPVSGMAEERVPPYPCPN
jgi:hypothetical protein